MASRWMKGMTLAVSGLSLLMIAALLWRSLPILYDHSPLELLFTTAWKPSEGRFGFWSYIIGTGWVTGVAVLLSVPLCLLTSIYLSEYAHRRVRRLIAPLIDLLAGIPSVVYGLWGILVIVPMVEHRLAPLFGKTSSGYSVLAAGMVLAVMIVPLLIHISLEVFQTIPREMREASLALGATRWETVKFVVLKKSLPGLMAAVVLGISRAFGETMVVLMVAGNVAIRPGSVFDPAYPLPALIANNYGEMLSVPKYDAALMFASLALLLVIVLFNVVTRVVMMRVAARDAR